MEVVEPALLLLLEWVHLADQPTDHQGMGLSEQEWAYESVVV